MNPSLCSSLGRLEPLQRQFRRAAIKVKHRVEEQSIYEAERVSDALGQCQRFAAEGQALLGIPKQPVDLCAHEAGAGPNQGVDGIVTSFDAGAVLEACLCSRRSLAEIARNGPAALPLES
jgi:hypothetical protein